MNEAVLTPPETHSPDAGQIPVKRRRKSAAVPNDDDWLVSLPRLCELLQLPERWVRRLVSEGKLPAIKIGNRLAFNPKRVRDHLSGVAKYNRFGNLPDDPLPRKR
jgi:excisionase family DNA binding protein